MSADDFFSRWSRKAAKPEAPFAQAPEDPALKKPEDLTEEAGLSADSAIGRPVTLQDVAGLTRDSDYSPFVANGIDEAIKRSAMKKLFSDPHFNLMDGLDIYIDDYSVFEPIRPEMLALIEHAKPLLDPLKQLQNAVVSLLQETDAGEGKVVAAGAAQDEAGDSAAMQASIDQTLSQERKFDGSIETLTQEQAAAEASLPPNRISDR